MAADGNRVFTQRAPIAVLRPEREHDHACESASKRDPGEFMPITLILARLLAFTSVDDRLSTLPPQLAVYRLESIGNSDLQPGSDLDADEGSNRGAETHPASGLNNAFK